MIKINESFIEDNEEARKVLEKLRNRLPRGFGMASIAGTSPTDSYEIFYNTVGKKIHRDIEYAEIKFNYFLLPSDPNKNTSGYENKLMYNLQIKCDNREKVERVYIELDKVVKRFAPEYWVSIDKPFIVNYGDPAYPATPPYSGNRWTILNNFRELNFYREQVTSIIHYIEGRIKPKQKGRV